MEVHHHPDLNHKKKKTREYFLEFLMIFLAVTMGFIAENVREHFAETKHAKEYLESYRNDLLENQIKINRYDSAFKAMQPVYDSIVTTFYARNENKELPVLSRLIMKGQRNYIITINTPTYQQMISSGSMRYIDNVPLKTAIAAYQDEINELINYNDRLINTVNNVLADVGKIEDFHDIWNTKKGFTGYQPEMQPFALSQEQRNFIITYNKLFTVQLNSDGRRLKDLEQKNTQLIAMINNELNK